ncbi:hypothetical protein JMG10_45870 [Nostoc ellipsosporum NOK]|nr:hypothetical protein [Nostoc ellipsosporum NOK]
MADYPSRIISGGAIIQCQGNSNSQISQGGSLRYAARFSSVVYCLISSFTVYGLSNGRCLLIASTMPNVQSLAKTYFNNGFSQDSQFVYLSKSLLGLPVGLNLNLEAFFVALLLLWLNRKQGTEQKVEVTLMSDGDKDGNKLYFTIQITFKKAVTVVNDYEIQPVYAISPSDL